MSLTMRGKAVAVATAGVLGFCWGAAVPAPTGEWQRAAAIDLQWERTDPSAVWDLQPCTYEDASAGPLPCLWDASTEGNGVGLSFWASPGPRPGWVCYTYFDPTADDAHGGCEDVHRAVDA